MKQDKQEFDFIREKIKDKPINKKRMLIHLVYDIFCAAVFGAVACCVFVGIKPRLEEWQSTKKQTVTIPKDEEPEEEKAEPKEEQETIQTPETVYVREEVGLEDYQNLQRELYAIGKRANSSIVTVTGVSSRTDWFNTSYESENQTGGIIIANNGRELLILTEKKVIADAQSIEVTFNDNRTVPAVLKKYDTNTGIAILAVALKDISEETMNRIEVAKLGNSYILTQGSVVIAIGNPQGVNYSILCGTITSSQNKVTMIDNNYTIFTTDMPSSDNGSGVLLNLSGEVVGLIYNDYSNQKEEDPIKALSISELKQVIEDLSNYKDIPYLGLRISTVTEGISGEYNIPKGVYVKGVEMESPAMAAGIQEADVIVEMNGEEIFTVEQYHQMLMSLEPGAEVQVTVKRQGAEDYVELRCTAAAGVLQ